MTISTDAEKFFLFSQNSASLYDNSQQSVYIRHIIQHNKGDV